MESDSTDSSQPSQNNKFSLKYLSYITIAALGVVYGDIGTSPLYALRECFQGTHSLPVTQENILGVLSLIFWALIIIISMKYILIIMRADNDGEGGILALMELVKVKNNSYKGFIILAFGLFGASLLYGDGVITPAISVLSAVEGLKIATSQLDSFIVPITVIILFLLFKFQKNGTGKVGIIFGPITLIWFIAIAISGVDEIVSQPSVFLAINPYYAVRLFLSNGFHAFIILGSVFLVVTGGEALYADMGHFGKKPIRFAWFTIVLPSLMLNYFGQGALLLTNKEAAINPFYLLVPDWGLYPMVILATSATVIASQALISGAFSLTLQASQLGFLPRMRILHTSEEEKGQIYIPFINWLLFVVTVWLVLEFKNSSNLAAAYGIAITTTMVITTILAFFAMRYLWKWNLFLTIIVISFFLLIDLLFWGSNMLKFFQGGWVPLLLGALVYLIITTWNKGRKILRQKLQERTQPLDEFIEEFLSSRLMSISGTAIYMYSSVDGTPPALAQNLKHNKILHKQILILSFLFHGVPRIKEDQRLGIENPLENFYRIKVNYGFMEQANIYEVIKKINESGIKVDIEKSTFYLGREIIIPGAKAGMSTWREKIFVFLSHNSQKATEYFNLPHDRVFEVGTQVII